MSPQFAISNHTKNSPVTTPRLYHTEIRPILIAQLRLIQVTRPGQRLRLGISPRGSLALYRCGQARAVIESRDFVLPEDIRALPKPVLAHRIILETKSKYGGVLAEDIVGEVLGPVSR